MSKENRSIAFVVDDEEMIASTLELILLSEGFDARSFADPLEALSASESVAPRLLVTDVCMPEMNGVELAIQVMNRCPDCRVLLFSGQPSVADLCAEAELKGHNFQILTKPVHPDMLLGTIKGLFEPVAR
jgi:DNA-binding NtrC family response regulator